MRNRIQILSTKKINNSLVQLAGENNIAVDELNFIETKESISEEIKKRIAELSKENVAVVFSSSNAVNAVGKIVPSQTNWKIFCIEPTTKKTVENIFTNSSIAGTAKDAENLSEKIIQDHSVKQIIFFCGNQRRDLLPVKVKKNGIDVEEIIVYKTIERPQFVLKKYDAILFFSQSAVRSFFTNNKLDETTKVFSLGETTADEVKIFSKNSIIISEIPTTENLIEEVVKYFTSIKAI